ncbi:MAG: energy transducer TonB [Candidatus Marinimicrobia bacterium]|nr:energy transducer TonB [Candidatus Neomarinimicrobiota bacterium]
MNNYDKFKNKGPFRTEIMIVAVLAIIVLLVFLFPRFDRNSKIEKETTIIFIESIDVPIVDLVEVDVPAPRPVIPVLDEESDLPLDSTLFVWDFDTYEGDDTPPLPPDGNDDGTVIFTPYDEPPVPIGGMAAIARNVVYPEIAKEAGIEGTVYVQSYIDEKGVVQNCVINKGLPGTGLDEAAMDAIKKTKWKPAVQRDRSVGVWIAIPVTFKLNTR